MKNKSNCLNPKHFFVILLSVFLLITFSGIPDSAAILGPVHVEMNITAERLGASRANSATSFKIYMRLNENIEVNDWIKVWFPIDEASCNPEDICDGPLEIKGEGLEHPRFVPNEKYFEKYPESDEKEFTKLYEILDEYTAEARFYECSDCDDIEGKCRIVQDPSGLGCWIMGTVLPILPKDDQERFYRINQLEYLTSIGYSPCGACGQGGLKLIQTWNERSLQANSTVSVDAWRQGYNPIDYNISKRTGIITPATPGRYRLKIATKAEPTPVESDSFVLPCSEITKPLFTYERYAKKEYGTYSIDFGVGEGGALDKGRSKIALDFPECVNIKKGYSLYKHFSVNGVQRNYKDSVFEFDEKNNIVSFISPVDIDNMGHVTITIDGKLFENSCEEPFTVFVSTSSEPEFIESTPLEITIIEPYLVEISNIFLSNYRATMPTSFEFTLVPDLDVKVNSGDEIEIRLPEGTILPENPGIEKIKSSPNKITNIRIDDSTVFLTFDEDFKYPIQNTITFEEDFGIINTNKPDIYKLEVKISGSEKVSYSEPFTIQTPPLITELKLLDPDEPDGCGGWYRTPPVLSLKCRNPDAKIRLWYDDDPLDKAIVYSGPKRLHPGSQRPIIHFQAIYGDELEEPQSMQLFIDTVPPAIKTMQPGDEVVYTSKDSFTITGKRDFIEMLTNGGPSHQVADGVLIKVNDGEYTQIIEPEIFAVADRDSVESEWEHEVELVEGENIVTILGRDQACNEETWVRTIIRDTTVPYLELFGLVEGERVERESPIRFRVKSESDAIVYINKEIASIEKDLGDGTSIFYVDLVVPKHDTSITIHAESIDKANNSNSIMAIYWINYTPIRLKLWINSAKFFKNDEQISDLDPMPTTKSPPLPKALGGNTYMPVRSVLEAIGADIEWIGDERRVDIKLGDVSLQLWIDNPIAKINGLDKKIVSADGKTQLYPTIVNDRTMLPLRFAVETVGADVNWIADEQAIEIVYPSDTVGD